MSKTPFTRKHREQVEKARTYALPPEMLEALDAALEHLPEPEPEPLPDGPYLYRHTATGGDYVVRFIHDGEVTGFTSRDLSGPGANSIPQPISPDLRDRYEPIILIRGDGEVPDDLVDRVYQRVGMGLVAGIDHYAVRRVLQALIDEVGQ